MREAAVLCAARDQYEPDGSRHQHTGHEFGDG